jgi:uncharacterized protein (DUF2164 family)
MNKTPKERFDEKLNTLLETYTEDPTNSEKIMTPFGEEQISEFFTEIKTFFHTEWNTMVEGVIAEIDTNLKNNSDYNKGMCDAQNIIRRHLLK